MNYTQVSERFRQIFDELMELREAGQREYAHNLDNPFRNFESVGKYLDMPREKVLMTYAIKHLDGITSWVNGHESQREDVTGRIKDLIVYLMLLDCMIQQQRSSVTEPDSFGYDMSFGYRREDIDA
jgi:hypothetical protein